MALAWTPMEFWRFQFDAQITEVFVLLCAFMSSTTLGVLQATVTRWKMFNKGGRRSQGASGFARGIFCRVIRVKEVLFG